MALVKAEILWTRKCPLSCSHCSMPNDLERAPVDSMIAGLQNLKDLGITFLAIYGASPIYDFAGLPEYVKAAKEMGFLLTVITDGIDVKHKERLQELYDVGLRSVTMSYDFVPYDASSEKKTNRAVELLDWWMLKDDIRDGMIVSTVTSQNYQKILEDLPALFDCYPKLYFGFDFVHFDRMHPGSKVRGEPNELALTNEMVVEYALGILDMKREGRLIHPSEETIRFYSTNPQAVTGYSWTCTTERFPSWVTIDADGTVMPCDDFHLDRSLKVWEITETKWELWKNRNFKDIEEFCNGCAWNTHIDADLIKKGDVALSGYTHKKE